MRLTSIACSVALLAGACTPGARPYAGAAGTILSVVGGGLLIDASSTTCPGSDPDSMGWGLDRLGCDLDVGAKTALGSMLLVAGVVTIIAAAASPSAPEPPLAPLALQPAAPALEPEPDPDLAPPPAPMDRMSFD
jgi:hypothetical protein